MNELVFVEYGQAFTDSLTIAEMFSKRHDNVKRDIETVWDRLHDGSFVAEAKELGIDLDALKFEGVGYKDSQNRNHRKYILNFDAFLLVTMGYTTSKAMLIKVKYINAFNEMKKKLESPRVLTDREQLIASMKLSLETSEELSTVKNDLELVKHQVSEELTLNHGQQQTLHHEIKKRVESIKNDYELTSRELYSQIHSHLRRAFSAPRYMFVKRKDYDEAVSWVKSWRPLI